MSPSDLDEILDRLYAAPLSEFVALRNEAAKELRKAGERSTADEVKALRKPSAAAWAVNQLHFRGDEALDELARATAAVVEAHGDPAADLQGAVQERRRCVDRLVDAAREILEEAGHGTTRDQMRRVMGTIEGATAQEPGPGRLTEDLEAPGFDALLGLALAASPRAADTSGGRPSTPARPGKKTSRAHRTAPPKTRSPGSAPTGSTSTDESQEARVAALRAALQVEETRHGRAEREVTRADTARLAAEKRIERARAKIEELEDRLAQAGKALEEAQAEAEDRAAELEEAEAAQKRAAERVRVARERVDSALGPD